MPPTARGTLQLLQEDQRAQRLRSINNWQQITGTLDHFPVLTSVSPVVSGPAFVQRGDAIRYLLHWLVSTLNVINRLFR